MPNEAPYKCIGILGRLFGHRFQNLNYYTNDCQRCGMPKGGWKCPPENPGK